MIITDRVKLPLLLLVVVLACVELLRVVCPSDGVVPS